MLGNTNLNDVHQVEGLRRSVAMLPAGTGGVVLGREETLVLIDALAAALKAGPSGEERPGPVP